MPDYTPTTANERYLVKSLGTWSSISDVDVFLSRFNHANDYKDGDTELELGNYVTIQDGTYNAVWVIAGFDMEFYQTSADGNRYDNGLGICMIPQTHVTTGQWNTSRTTAGGYISSYMHNTVLTGIVTNLQNVLGSHIVQRNVLLSSSVDGNYSNAYTWTTAYATLMSIGQVTGRFATHRNQYDDGEANYKLPVFNSMDYNLESYFWTRGVRYPTGAWNSNVGVDLYTDANYNLAVRPLIYLR